MYLVKTSTNVHFRYPYLKKGRSDFQSGFLQMSHRRFANATRVGHSNYKKTPPTT